MIYTFELSVHLFIINWKHETKWNRGNLNIRDRGGIILMSEMLCNQSGPTPTMVYFETREKKIGRL